MRILFVTRKYPPQVGGMESLSYGLTTGYPEPKTIIALGRSQAHLVWFLPYVVLRVALTAGLYDVIHLGDALLSVVGFIPRVLWRRKVVTSVHGLDLTFTPRVYQRYLRTFLRADAFVANSESTRRLAESRGLTNVSTITIGVPEAYFALERSSEPDPELVRRSAGRVVLITLGRLVPRKGVAWFVRNVLPSLPDAYYVAVGVGPDQDEIERAAREAGVSERLWLTGGVSQERLMSLLTTADIFVMPNIEVPGNVEGFGIVAIEAAASGLPVVASRLQGIPDAIVDGKNGELVTPEDAAGFVTALARLMANRAERERRGQAGRAYTREHNSWPQIIARYRALFERVAARASS